MNQPPETCGVAFKEWAGICEALTRGRQSLILRKGGIDEGPGGFTPDHRAFWLYPTRVHQAEQGLKHDAPQPTATDPSPVAIGLSALALVDWVGRVESAERLDALDEFHVWTAETVRKRFHYRSPGLWVLGVRVFRRVEPLALPVTPEQAGCKTWVALEPAPATAGLAPVLDGRRSVARLDRIRAAVEAGPAR